MEASPPTLVAWASIGRWLMLRLVSDGKRWALECQDAQTGDTYRHREVRGVERSGRALFHVVEQRLREPGQHPANPDGEWWLAGWNPEQEQTP